MISDRPQSLDATPCRADRRRGVQPASPVSAGGSFAIA